MRKNSLQSKSRSKTKKNSRKLVDAMLPSPLPPLPPLLAPLLSSVIWIAAVKIALPRRIVSASPRKTLASVSHLFSPMEVEVKLRLADTNAHHRVNSLLSPFHVVTHRQKNLFFDGAASEVSERRIVLCLRFYGDDDRLVEEDEEDLDPRVGCEYVAEPGKLESRVLQRVKEEFGTKKGFIGLGER
ncbi:hypothetical protein V8G54_014350 [Vigna mungo]|uniref:CYTH domain-containing protein n=1 Tax=Vigna mungo TaxID=3915 RepID=A0AAQ3NJ21_VIGMU